MPDAVTQYSTLSNDALGYWIAQRQYALAERNLVVGRYAQQYTLPQRMGLTLRVTRHSRLALPLAKLTEGTPPDAVALSVEKVDVTVEQWGIVALLTDVVMVTTAHPALQIAVDRTGLAMAETLEREICRVLMGGTSVIYAGAATSRATLTGGGSPDKLTTTVALKATTQLRTLGAMPWEGQLYAGVMAPQMEADLLAADTTFQNASNFANVRALQYGEIGIWMSVRWGRGNFLPKFQTVAAPDTGAATATKAQITAVDTGGSLTSGNHQFKIVGRNAVTDNEERISIQSANISSGTGDNDKYTVALPTSTNYVYDIYMTAVAGTTAYLVKTRQTGGTSVDITTNPAGTEATPPANGKAAADEVFVAWVFGKDAFGRVELNGMSMQSYITEAGASWSNPLAQGRKVGSKIMWKCFIQDNNYFVRIEANSSFPGLFPA